MRTLLTILLFLSLNARSTTYYVSFNGGDDSRSAAQAQSSASPWKTIAKVNAMQSTFAPGDSILFKRGDTWVGEMLVPAKNGTSGSPIVYGAYGTGDNPKFSGGATIASWTSLGGNLYVSTSAVSTLSSVNILTINGVPFDMGRYPNADEANAGYFTIDTHTSDSVIFDAALPTSGTLNLTGTRAVVRVNHYLLDTGTVENHTTSGSTQRLDLKSANMSYDLINGYGYFLQNDPRFLDQHGEWYYNPTSKKCTLYLDAAPINYTIKVATSATLISLTSDSYLTFDGIDLEYGNEYGFLFGGSATNITIQNNVMQYFGRDAINTKSSTSNNLTVDNFAIYDVLNDGISGRGSGKITATNGIIKRVGLLTGMGGFANGAVAMHRHAINSNAAKSVFEYLVIDSLAYTGIRFGGDSTRINKNVIENFCLVLQDGGAIYTYEGGSSGSTAQRYGREIMYNHIKNGIGQPIGTASGINAAYGIYLDANSSGVKIWYNTIDNVAKDGMLISHSYNCDIRYNVMYNITQYSTYFYKSHLHEREITGIIYRGNVNAIKNTTGLGLYLYHVPASVTPYPSGQSIYTISTAANFDSNYYARPLLNTTVMRLRETVDPAGPANATNYTLTDYRAKVAYDDNSQVTPLVFDDSIDYNMILVKNPTDAPATIALEAGSNWKSVQGVDYNDEEIELPAWGSAVLLRTPGDPEPPPAADKKPLRRGNKILRHGSKILTL
jgi:hypothetical protein